MKKRGRRAQMFAAGALCHCGSHDVRQDGHSAIDGRPWFRCGSCSARWTSGHDGQPYITFATRALEQRV